jgi:esterase/lipase superfamily enzyme
MSPARRRLAIGASVFVAVALVLAAFFNVPTRRALERAEALQFRRMLVTRQGEQDEYRFFFVTNRRVAKPELETAERFASEREAGLRFGYFDTAIEPSLGVGMLVDPTDWFQNEEIQLRRLRNLDRSEFLEELRKQVDASPRRTLLVNVNGFRERFESSLRKTAFLAHVLDMNSPIMVFDWPGDQGSTPRGYRRAREVAIASGAELAEALALVIREVRPDHLWVVANSMGGEVVVNAFSQLYEQADLADSDTEIEDVVLTAPDVGHEEFNRRFKAEIDALARNVTVYVSSNDRALLMSRILNRERRLGESSVDPQNPDQFDEASMILQLADAEDPRVTLVDVTPVNRTRNFHNFSLETPEFFDDLFMRLVNEDTPRSRLMYRVKTPTGSLYWVLTGGR